MPKSREVPILTAARNVHLPDGSRSFKSPWVWRGLFFMSLIAFGLALTLFVGGHQVFAACWAVIAAGWFAVSMWLWRQNVKYMG